MTSAVEEMVDGVAEGVIRSETEKKGLFHQHDDGLAWVRSRDTRRGNLIGVSGATSLTLKGAKTVKMARPRHNSGLNQPHHIVPLLADILDKKPLALQSEKQYVTSHQAGIMYEQSQTKWRKARRAGQSYPG